MVTTCDPTLTGTRLRRICGDCCMRKYRVDPFWGIPAGTPPLLLDTSTGLIRPWSSFEHSIISYLFPFVGFSSEWFPPGEDHLVWVYTCGWVEMNIGSASGVITPTAVNAGDRFALGEDTGTPIDDQVIPQGGLPSGRPLYFEAVEGCFCQGDWVKRLNCLEDPPAANNTSPATMSDQMLQRTVIVQFGECCRPMPPFEPLL